MRAVLHPEADNEVRAAALWYDEQRRGLGDEFLSEVTAVIQRIEAGPGSFPCWPGASGTAEAVRRAVMHRFPYAVAFEAHAGHILVLAIAHDKRRPLYWLARATGPA